MLLRSLSVFTALSGLGAAIVLPRASDCTNTATTRSCWGDGFDIDTDSDTTWPTTGVTVKYDLVLTNETMAPDGTDRWMLVFNGQYPGPTLVADWGDTLEITVTNNIVTDSTSIHWHGVTQKNTNTMDGVNGVTECPIPPGGSRTYTFIATAYGTSWYHSHHSAQYGDGVAGSIQINGPASANYDYDLGVMPITDFYYTPMFDLSAAALQAPPTASNGLINGTNMNEAQTAGSYNTVTNLIAGATYRLRLVNMAVDNHFIASLDSHTFTVISADFVPIVPYNTTSLFIAIGQRYDVIFTADQTADNYWFRALIPGGTAGARGGGGCGANSNAANIRAVFNYEGVTLADPTSSENTIVSQACVDETQLVPYVAKDVPSSDFVYPTPDYDLTVEFQPGHGVFEWNINGTAFDIDWADPTLNYVLEGNTSYTPDQRILKLPDADTWAFWVITNGNGVPHPIHLHGHDFYLLGQGSGSFTGVSQLNFVNPPRRDVAMLEGSGFMVIAFLTDNPGAWLLHCHIAWHAGEGLAVQFLERVDDISTTVDLDFVTDGCSAYNDWYGTRTVTAWNTQYDSGI